MKRNMTRYEREHRNERRIILTVLLALIIAIALSSITVAESTNMTPADVFISSMTTPEPPESWE
ncbi:MAG: hypothetical protein VB112_03055 [Oscillospiraceae bacterium]|nr:hypothetical protein [Oscillospiraceae bacterium]